MNRLGKPHIPNATYRVRRSSRSLLVLEKISKGFLPYMGVTSISDQKKIRGALFKDTF